MLLLSVVPVCAPVSNLLLLLDDEKYDRFKELCCNRVLAIAEY